MLVSPIIVVSPETVVRDEQLGSKNKFWFKHAGKSWLFKEARENTGEDWAEKVVSCIAEKADISAGFVQLAEFKGTLGCASRSFIGHANESLVHGNEILAAHIAGYERSKRVKQSDHTLNNIWEAIEGLYKGQNWIQAGILGPLAEYLVLDALVGNTDRHHENWGLLVRDSAENGDRAQNSRIRIAPTFDHASSLGRELTDSGRAEILGKGLISRYASRGRGGIYVSSSDPHGASPLDLIRYAITGVTATYFLSAIRKITAVPLMHYLYCVDLILAVRMSAAARVFAKDFLTFTYGDLKKLAQ